MPTNLIKKYPQLLELTGNLSDILTSLRRIYNRDIQDNPDFKFRGIPIHPLKSEGQEDMDRTFRHLTTKEYDQFDDDGTFYLTKDEILISIDLEDFIGSITMYMKSFLII